MEGSVHRNACAPLLPPGFRFYPTDQELILHYLKEKVSSSSNPFLSVIADVDIYKYNPWELPGKAVFGEEEWFFFSPRNRKYPNGTRPNRTTAVGYWKATGGDKPILDSSESQCLGVKKALTFYRGRPPKGVKTSWVMHEYRLLEHNRHYSHRLGGTLLLDDWVLCRVRRKSSCKGAPGDEYNESNGSSSDQMTFNGILHGQECIQNSPILDSNEGQIGVLATQESEGGQRITSVDDFQDASPEFTTSEASSCNFGAPRVVPSFEEALESIKKTLSIADFDELALSNDQEVTLT
ncbi:NAC transcription factor 32-like [Rhodamnia argentea]|uniref:NAC transcription factor 32-like n=1 Tax=Rhodamnia argentea TaxID=178133 RepID=A0A8B8MRE4_9MYRT|nr:NAC transcription factor 32-like [Rhodamnia argentea]